MELNKEVVIAYVADIGGLKPVVDLQQQIHEKTQRNIEDEKAASEKLYNQMINDRKKINEIVAKNQSQLKDQVATFQQAEKILESFYKTGTKAFDNKKVQQFGETVKKQFDKLQGLSSLSFDFNEKDLQTLSSLLNSTENEFQQLLIVMSVMQGKLDEMDFKDENAQKLNDELEKLTPQVEALAMYVDKTGTEFKTLNQELTVTKHAMAVLESEGKQNSERYKELRDRAVQLQKAIKDVNDEIKHSASDTAGLENVIGAVNGLVGIYATAQGAAALFGEENEELEKTIQKLGGALAVLNGLQAVQAELSNKQGLATKALTWTQNQYTIATNASATATTRFGAALKLLGVGLVIGGIAALVVYWKDIAKAIGLTNEEVERNAEISQRSNELYGEQIAKLTLLNKQVKEGGLSFRQKQAAVKDFNAEFGKTLGSVKNYNELEARMIKNGETYIQYVKLKAQAEAAYQLAIEKTKKAIEDRERVLNKDFTAGEKFTLWDEKLTSQLENFFFGSAKLRSQPLTNEDFENLMGLPDEKSVEKFLSQYSATNKRILEEYYDDNKNSDSLLNRQTDYLKGLDELAKKAGDINPDVDEKKKKKVKDWTDEIRKLIAELIKLQEQYAISGIENDREREIAERTKAFTDEKKFYQDQIDAITGNNQKKLEVQRKFNETFNEENGIAYESFQKDILEINKKYTKQAEEVRLQAMQAIREVNGQTTAIELQAIKDRWDEIRKGLERELELTNDVVEQAKLRKTIQETINAQKTEENQFLLGKDNEDLKLQQEMVNKMISIWATGNTKILNNEKVVQTQRLLFQKMILEQMLENQKKYLNESQKTFLEDIANQIMNMGENATPEQWQEISDQLKDMFGEETANQILDIIKNIKDVNKEIEDLNKKPKTLENWFNSPSVKDFTDRIAKFFKLTDEETKTFSANLAYAIVTVWDTITSIIDKKITDHQNKLSEIENLISQTESELEQERQLYEDGYANNYDLRKQELADLRKQKAEELELLRKAQREQAAIQKAQIIASTAMQIANLAEAATNIFKGTTKMNPIVGVALGAALAATLIAAFMSFKGTAEASASPSFRKGLEEGALDLKGSSHERGGMGLYDSVSGRKVAEYEGGEQLFALNKGQQSKYGWLMQAMIDDAKGRKPIMDTLMGRIPNTGKKLIHKVRQVNEITVSANQKRAEASNEQRELLQEMKKFNKRFDEEFGGYKNERQTDVKSWETPNYFFVKENGIVKKYKKIEDDEQMDI